jgi:hypothetical protein
MRLEIQAGDKLLDLWGLYGVWSRCKAGWKIEAILRSKESKTLELYIKREARQSAENPQK